jgi:hypothetical protein
MKDARKVRDVHEHEFPAAASGRGEEVATSPAEAFRYAGGAAARSPPASARRSGDEGLKPLKVQ